MNRLLIVEDEINQRELYTFELSDEGYEIDSAANGREALLKLEQNSYDLVIMDMRMPDMDGIETLARMIARKDRVPVIIYSSHPQYKNNFLTWTADAYLTKSSNISELKRKINELLESNYKSGSFCH